MQSLKELYKIGNGPSSSHTMGPKRATELFKNKYQNADKFKIILYGSLAMTGKGHLTDYIIKKTLDGYKVEIEFDTQTECKVHPNTFDIFAYKKEKLLDTWRVYSIGGGSFKIAEEKETIIKDIYPQKNFNEIKEYIKENNLDLYDYVCLMEGKEEITEILSQVWDTMKSAIKKRINNNRNNTWKIKITKKSQTHI